MGDENLEDKIKDIDYQNAIYASNVAMLLYQLAEDYKNAGFMYQTWKHLSEDYIKFRLDKYDSEGRKVIRETYKILGYNPFKGNNNELR